MRRRLFLFRAGILSLLYVIWNSVNFISQDDENLHSENLFLEGTSEIIVSSAIRVPDINIEAPSNCPVDPLKNHTLMRYSLHYILPSLMQSLALSIDGTRPIRDSYLKQFRNPCWLEKTPLN